MFSTCLDSVRNLVLRILNVLDHYQKGKTIRRVVLTVCMQNNCLVQLLLLLDLRINEHGSTEYDPL